MNILVTGAAGFIGAAVSQYLLDRADSVTGIDDLNNYYDISLKKARLKRLTESDLFTFKKLDISNRINVSKIFASNYALVKLWQIE